MKKFLIYLKTRPLARISCAVLILLYAVMIFAEFIAPYEPTKSFEDMSFHPPTVRFVKGSLKVQEVRVINPVIWKYARVKNMYHDISFFVKTEPYKLAGFIPCSRRLFGVEAADQTGSVNQTDSAAAMRAEPAYPVFLLGADALGRDIFSRIVYGSRISLTIGFIAAAVSLSLAVLFGGLAGFYGGFIDWLVMRIAEFFMLIPGLYIILFLRSLLSSKMDSGQSYMIITVILSLVSWPGTARTIRGLVHSIKREEFVLNAVLEGIPSPLIIMKHIIPQISSILIISTALSIPGFIMSETVLSYLGLGITDPAVSWGSLINRDISTLSNLKNFPWLMHPMWLLLAVTLAFNFLGDALRDYFDPYHTIVPRRRRNIFQERFIPTVMNIFRHRKFAGNRKPIS